MLYSAMLESHVVSRLGSLGSELRALSTPPLSCCPPQSSVLDFNLGGRCMRISLFFLFRVLLGVRPSSLTCKTCALPLSHRPDPEISFTFYILFCVITFFHLLFGFETTPGITQDIPVCLGCTLLCSGLTPCSGITPGSDRGAIWVARGSNLG